MATSPDVILAFVSGLPVAILGGVLLAVRPRRPEQVAFGAFAVLWGCQILAANAGRLLADPEVHSVGLLVSLGLMACTYLALAYFAAVVQPSRLSHAAVAVAAVLAVVGAFLILLAPHLVVAAVDSGPASLSTTFGPAALPFFHAPFLASFYYAIVLLNAQYREAPPGTRRHRLRGMLLALALFACYVTARQLVVYMLPGGLDGVASFSTSSTRTTVIWSAWGQAAVVLAGAVALAAVAAQNFLRPPPPEERDLALFATFLLPAFTGFLEGILHARGDQFETLGFWRLLAIAALVYTLARYQLFDLDLKMKRFAGPGLAAIFVIFGIPIALSFGAGDVSIETLAFTVFGEALAVGTTFLFRGKIEEAAFPGVEATPDYVHQRKLEVYRVALEDAVGRGHPPDAPDLRDLRIRLGIQDEEHRILTWMVKPRPTAGDATASDLKPGAIVLDRYRIDRVIGTGTTGTTYVATDVSRRLEVAVKVVPLAALGGDGARRLLREQRLAASLVHPNILQILDVGETATSVVMVMEYAENGNLGEWLAKRGPLPLAEACRVLDEILAALEAVHRARIVHRNLKPKNVLVEDVGTVKLADFGAAVAGDADEGERGGEILLSLIHLSPEQVDGRHVDARSDLYAAAVLFHQALTGRHYLPLAGRSEAQIREMIRHADPALDLGKQPSWVYGFLREALAKDPENRYRDATAMRAALAAGLGKTAVAARA